MSEENKMDFGSLDSIMMLMMFSASQLIDKALTIEQQANRIAEFNASFMAKRLTHETSHITKKERACPFCMSMELSLSMNREKVKD